MVFSSPFFLFFFLPLTLLLTYLSRNSSYRNGILLFLSIFFYIFGEGEMIILMLCSITFNFYIGKWIDSAGKKEIPLSVGVIINLLLLIICKYSSFIVENINVVLAMMSVEPVKIGHVKLPVGISFYTFHSISYLVDVYRKENKVQKSYVDLALYISLFPQLVAGPIIRYKDIAAQFTGRVLNSAQFQLGIQRFIIGLGKKVIIANSLGFVTDSILLNDPAQLSTATAWFAILSYSLQLYFDFSGYSDMAIGLAKMLGFDFLENFNFPYIAKSIREFWQRWHISLSNWFRDYLYIPLGGNRVSNSRVYLNLFIVFFVTGLWHGASWNFVIWGLLHGFFMIIERLGFGKVLARLPGIVQHIYTLFVVVLAWVFFRAETLPKSLAFVKALFGTNSPDYTLDMFINRENVFSFIVGAILAVNGINRVLRMSIKALYRSGTNVPQIKSVFRTVKMIVLCIIFIYSVFNVASGTYNPFIYFRF